MFIFDSFIESNFTSLSMMGFPSKFNISIFGSITWWMLSILFFFKFNSLSYGTVSLLMLTKFVSWLSDRFNFNSFSKQISSGQAFIAFDPKNSFSRDGSSDLSKSSFSSFSISLLLRLRLRSVLNLNLGSSQILLFWKDSIWILGRSEKLKSSRILMRLLAKLISLSFEKLNSLRD